MASRSNLIKASIHHERPCVCVHNTNEGSLHARCSHHAAAFFFFFLGSSCCRHGLCRNTRSLCTHTTHTVLWVVNTEQHCVALEKNAMDAPLQQPWPFLPFSSLAPPQQPPVRHARVATPTATQLPNQNIACCVTHLLCNLGLFLFLGFGFLLSRSLLRQ